MKLQGTYEYIYDDFKASYTFKGNAWEYADDKPGEQRRGTFEVSKDEATIHFSSGRSTWSFPLKIEEDLVTIGDARCKFRLAKK